MRIQVLVLTQSKRRLGALRQVAARVAAGDRRGQYYFATFGAFAPAFSTATWADLDGKTYAGVLYAE